MLVAPDCERGGLLSILASSSCLFLSIARINNLLTLLRVLDASDILSNSSTVY